MTTRKHPRWKHHHSSSSNNDDGKNPKQLLVIGAGLSRTATSSFVAALARLGLKSYHMKFGVLETPGHLNLWSEHAKERLQGRPGLIPAIMDRIAEDGFQATADLPSALLYQDFMERYPDARVVLTVRSDGDGEAWATSFMNTLGQNTALLQRVPYRWIPKAQKLFVLLRWIRAATGSPIDETTALPKHEDLVLAYNNWFKQVRATVPPQKLLVFSARDGWRPLCDFLSPLEEESISAACQQILDLGEPYPRVNETADVRSVYRFLVGVSLLFEYSPFLLLLMVLLWRTKRRCSSARVKQKTR